MSEEKKIFDENTNESNTPEVIHAEDPENSVRNGGEEISEAIVPAISPPGVIVFP